MTSSIRDKIFKYDQLVPRYTSYPTAPHFKMIEEDRNPYPDLITQLPDDANISLYLHVPFCSKMCWYCGCHTKITQRYAPVENYAHLMMREIKILADLFPSRHTIQNIHFGGGSPSILHNTDFKKIMDSIRNNFRISDAVEIAVEIDPRGLTEDHIRTYAESGVNRISLGVQDFDDKVLKSVNREQPFELTETAIRLFRQYNIHHFNFDLLYGLPYQTPLTMKETIDKTLSLDPDRVSLFGYAHVPWMKKHMRLIDESALPCQSERYDLFETGSYELQKSGYTPIGIDHFAKPNDHMTQALKSGNLHRNFQGYTTDKTDALIGIGSSAIGRFKNGYVQNAIDMPHYTESILSGNLAARKYYNISNQDKLCGTIIERLMCDFKVDLGEYCHQYGYPTDYLDSKLPELEKFEKDGLITITEKRKITIHPEAKQIVRVICCIFDEYFVNMNETLRHAKAI